MNMNRVNDDLNAKARSVIRSLRTWNIALWIVGLLPLIAMLTVMPVLPDRVPTHFGLNGKADGWGSRTEGLFLPVLCVLAAIFWSVFERIVAKQTLRTASAADARQTVRVLIIGGLCMFTMFNVINAYSLWMALSATTNLDGPAITFNQILNILVGITYIVVGNFAPQTKPNSLTGMRIRSAYASREAWRRCQRVRAASYSSRPASCSLSSAHSYTMKRSRRPRCSSPSWSRLRRSAGTATTPSASTAPSAVRFSTKTMTSSLSLTKTPMLLMMMKNISLPIPLEPSS